MKDLTEIREEIDKVDSAILDLYERRMKITEDVAEYKISVGKPVYDKDRETAKLDKLSSMASTDFTAKAIRELYEQIMSVSRINQYRILAEHGMKPELEFTPLDELETQGKTVVYQGVEGAYSQIAMQEFFGEEGYDSYHVYTWREAVNDVLSEKADFAVLPIENSSAGDITENFDHLNQNDIYIVGEQVISINHSLLGVKGADISDLKTVYSHPQAILQCDGYLRNNHSEWTAIAVSNTAMAAKKISEEGDISQGAIGSARNAELYGLDVIEECIQDNKTNCTRFVVVSKKKEFKKDAGKISLCFEIANEKGSLYHILSYFIYNGLNMVKIESRPIPNRTWEYRFFVDIEGNLLDENVVNAITGIKSEATYLKILGNY